MPLRPLAAVLAAVLVAGTATACGATAAGTPPDGRLAVVTAFYPLRFLATRLGGDRITVTDLTKPGAEPHDVELNPRQVGQISDAALVVYLKGFQPAVDEAVEQEAADRGFDAGATVDLLPVAAEEHEHVPGEEEHAEAAGGNDPHVWLDPVRFAAITRALGERLAATDPAHAAGYRARAAAVQRDLETLHAEFAAGLRSCARHEFVTSHEAFHYLAERYGLTEVGITGISPEAEPSPRRLAEVAAEARATGTTTIFFETLVSPEVAETIAREVGARTAVLDPLEGLTEPGADYFSVMRRNLAALQQALGCTS
ncbi:MAG TPA: metal ABC transporter substrate-binding protein [Actinoplanes sp.]|nr:metal ABC transporter substrate-binding protein [Actinoplanes sp.]